MNVRIASIAFLVVLTVSHAYSQSTPMEFPSDVDLNQIWLDSTQPKDVDELVKGLEQFQEHHDSGPLIISPTNAKEWFGIDSATWAIIQQQASAMVGLIPSEKLSTFEATDQLNLDAYGFYRDDGSFIGIGVWPGMTDRSQWNEETSKLLADKSITSVRMHQLTGSKLPKFQDEKLDALYRRHLEPESIEDLKRALTTESERLFENPLYVPPAIVKQWLQNDSAAWAAIQQQRPAAIDLGQLLGEEPLRESLAGDGLDPYAVYDKENKFLGIIIRVFGMSPGEFGSRTIGAETGGTRFVPLRSEKDGKQTSSIFQRLQNELYEAGKDLCEFGLMPENISVNSQVGIGISGGIEVTFKAEKLCKWFEKNTT